MIPYMGADSTTATCVEYNEVLTSASFIVCFGAIYNREEPCEEDASEVIEEKQNFNIPKSLMMHNFLMLRKPKISHRLQ